VEFLYDNFIRRSFETGKLQVFVWILELVNDPEITKYCMEANEKDGVSLYHSAASADCPVALEVLLNHFGISAVVNARCTVDGNNCVTPLSLILSHGHVEHFKLLIDFNLNPANTEKLVQINLSDTKIEEFSLSVLRFSSVKSLFLDKTGLKLLTCDGMLSMPDVKELRLKELRATHNVLTELPSELFTLPKLEILNVSHNRIEKLPDNWLKGVALGNINLSNNLLEELPLPGYVEEDTEPDSNRHALCGRSELVFNELPKIPTQYSVTAQEEFFSPLKKLILSNNLISTFPKYLCCCVPVLKHLDVSHNQLTEVASINEIPISLEALNVSHNRLGTKDNTIFSVSLQRRSCIATCKDEYHRCHHCSHTSLPKLCTLDLSNNEHLKAMYVQNKLPTANMEASFLSSKHTNVHLFFPCLKKLNVSNCNLTKMPKYFSRMKLLSQLNISGNKNLKIPAEICQLRDLFQFEYNGVNDDDIVFRLNQFEHVKDKVKSLNPLYRDRYVFLCHCIA